MTLLNENARQYLENIIRERFNSLFMLHEISYGCLAIRLDGTDQTIVFDHVVSDLFSKFQDNIPCAKWNAVKEGFIPPIDDDIPAPGASLLQLPLIEQTRKGYTIHYDILRVSLWILSRQEEVGSKVLDMHGRFPASSSHAFKYKYLDRPIVDEWFCILGQVIKRLWPQIQLTTRSFSVEVSHDVDFPSRYAFASAAQLFRRMGADLMKRYDYRSLLLAPWLWVSGCRHLSRCDPMNSFDWIMDISEKYGIKSSFYFICGKTSGLDSDYEIEHSAIRDLIRRIHLRKHIIGLHPSYNSCSNAGAIFSEASKLVRICLEEGIEQETWGARMHYLRGEQPATLNLLAKAGLSYDCSLGYADMAGFRCGTCFEYPGFDPVAQAIIDIRVRPLIAMECSVIDSCYMGLGVSEEAFLYFKHLKNAARAVGGCFTLLWHNSELDSKSKRLMYVDILNA